MTPDEALEHARARLRVRISLGAQTLWLLDPRGGVEAEYAVSTAANGAGERSGSGCTPRGWHRVRAKIGAGLPPGTVFVGRRPSGQVYGPALEARHPGRDWILTRILWLGGLEPGRNRYGSRDTQRRYIYIHGCSPRAPMGEPRSHGCIRMRDAELLALFDAVRAGDGVLIEA